MVALRIVKRLEKEMGMPPFMVPPLLKWVLASVGGAAVVHWVVKEIRRVNEELERVRAASPAEAMARSDMPTLRRDPVTGEWRLP